MDANTNPIELCGTVAAVIYQNEENGYTVLKLDVDDGSQTMVVGCIPYAVPGESMIVTGSWMTPGCPFGPIRTRPAKPYLIVT